MTQAAWRDGFSVRSRGLELTHYGSQPPRTLPITAAPPRSNPQHHLYTSLSEANAANRISKGSSGLPTPHLTMPQYTLNPVTSSPQPEAAVLCRFPHGPPSALVDPLPPSPPSPSSCTSPPTPATPRKSSHRVLTCDSAAVEWTGSNFGSSSFKLQPYTYAVGVVREAERRIDLLPVNHVYSMQQRVKPHQQRLPTKGADSAGAGAEAASYAVRQKALIDSFGSKKRKSQLASKESNKVVVQQHIAHVLDTSLATNQPQARQTEDEGEDGEDEETDEAVMRRTKKDILPPFNEHTDDPMAIYPFDGLLPPSIYPLLLPEAKRLLALSKDEALLSSLVDSLTAPQAPPAEAMDTKPAPTAASAQVSRFSLHRLQQLTHHPNAAAALRVCALLALYQLLLTVKGGHPRYPRKALAALPHPPAAGVQQWVLETFTTGVEAPVVGRGEWQEGAVLVGGGVAGGGRRETGGEGDWAGGGGCEAGRRGAGGSVQRGGVREGVQGRGAAARATDYGTVQAQEEEGCEVDAEVGGV